MLTVEPCRVDKATQHPKEIQVNKCIRVAGSFWLAGTLALLAEDAEKKQNHPDLLVGAGLAASILEDLRAELEASRSTLRCRRPNPGLVKTTNIGAVHEHSTQNE